MHILKYLKSILLYSTEYYDILEQKYKNTLLNIQKNTTQYNFVNKNLADKRSFKPKYNILVDYEKFLNDINMIIYRHIDNYLNIYNIQLYINYINLQNYGIEVKGNNKYELYVILCLIAKKYLFLNQ